MAPEPMDPAAALRAVQAVAARYAPITRCDRCRVYEATMMIDDEWLCEVCTSGVPDADDDYPSLTDDATRDHGLNCECEMCQEDEAWLAARTDGILP